MGSREQRLDVVAEIGLGIEKAEFGGNVILVGLRLRLLVVSGRDRDRAGTLAAAKLLRRHHFGVRNRGTVPDVGGHVQGFRGRRGGARIATPAAAGCKAGGQQGKHG